MLGRNGAGKTTLFNIINDDLKAEHGKVYLVDNEEKTRKLDIEDIGYVISAPVVPNFLTGREMLKFFIEINQKRIKDLKTIDEYFDMVSIDELDRDKLAKDYSHGMKNKMMMLLNFISNPDVWLLDEPLTSLDVVVADDAPYDDAPYDVAAGAASCVAVCPLYDTGSAVCVAADPP